MGFKQIDLVPFPSQISPITPAGKPIHSLVIQVPRTQTVNTVMAEIPAQASLTGVKLFGSVVSNAATTATVTLTMSNSTGVISTGTYDVKTNGATTGEINMTALPNIEPQPLLGDLIFNAVYAETGTASSAGGPWNILISYVC